MLGLERENVHVGQLQFSPCCSVCRVPGAVWQQDCTSRTAKAVFHRTALDTFVTMRVRQAVKFIIFAFVISCYFTCKVLNQSVSGKRL